MFKLQQIETHNHTATSTPLLYDPFLFVDSLTNRSIPVKYMRDKSMLLRTHRHSKTTAFSEEKEQIRELDECIDFLKETITFRKNALRQKLFGDLSKKEESMSQQQELICKKRLIRQLISQQIQQKSRNEFDKYMNMPNHKLDQNLLKVTKNNNFLISKKTISKIVNSLEKKEGQPFMTIRKRCEQNEDPFLDRMNFIEQEMKNEIREKLRKSGEFLVDPQYHFVQAKSFGATKFKNQFSKQLDERRDFLKQMKWQPNSMSKENLLRTRGKVAASLAKTANGHKHEAQIINLVANAQVEDVQIFTQKHKKQNLKARDQKGNTLFHIAVLNNKTPTFEWLLSKLGVSSLLVKNEDGETAPDLAVRLDRREILAYIPRSMI